MIKSAHGATAGSRFGCAALLGLCMAFPTGAIAGEWDDCGPLPTQKTESACTAIVSDAARSDADHARAYINRARAYVTAAKFDLATPDLEAALKLDDRSVPA
jgi:hypothetical protein